MPNHDNRKIIYIMDHKEQSHHCEYPDYGGTWYYRALRDKELPLHLNKAPKEYLELIKKRLKGEIKEIPIIQDLVDRKEKINHKRKRMSHLIALYEQVLINYLYDNWDYSKRYYTTDIVVLTIKEHDYLFTTVRGANFKMIRESNIGRIKI